MEISTIHVEVLFHIHKICLHFIIIFKFKLYKRFRGKLIDPVELKFSLLPLPSVFTFEFMTNL